MNKDFIQSQRLRLTISGSLIGLIGPLMYSVLNYLLYHYELSFTGYLSLLFSTPEDIIILVFISGAAVVMGAAGYMVGKLRECDSMRKYELVEKNKELEKREKELRELTEHLEGKIIEGCEEVIESAAKVRETNDKLMRQIDIQRKIAGNIPSLLALIDPNLNYVEINEYGSRYFLGKPMTDILGHKCYEVSGNTDVCIENCAVKRAFETGRECTHTRTAIVNGKEIVVENKSIPLKDPEGRVTHVLKIVNDATARKKEEDDLKRRANYDALTGLYNKHYLDRYLTNEEQLNKNDKRKRGPYTIIFADLDNLKDANDTYGHEAGDILLRKIAQVFQDNTRHEDIVARVGGDEFVIVLPHSGPEEGEVLINRFRRQSDDWNRTKDVDDRLRGLTLGVSYGLGTSVYGMDLYDTIKKADTTMYRAKRGKKAVSGEPEESV